MFELWQFSTLHFLRPWWLLLLLPVICGVLYAHRRHAVDSSNYDVIAAHLVKALTVAGGNFHWFNPLNMGALILALCVVLMAGPSWQRQASPFSEDNGVLVIALDLSQSMNQSDVQPTRLERAKQKIDDLLTLRGDARTGLIAYAGSAHQVIPLSNDANLIRQFLAAVDSAMMPRKGKLPETVLPLTDRMLQGAAQSSASIPSTSVPATLLVIGDGISAKTLAKFSQYFARTPYQLLVLGVGSNESSASTADDDSIRPLQENLLRELAETGKGYYQRSTSDKRDVQRINRMIDHHFATADDTQRPWRDAGYFLLYPIALLFVLWFRKGWTLNWCVALFCIHALGASPPTFAQQQSDDAAAKPSTIGLSAAAVKQAFIDLWLSADQQGRYYFERKDYLRAAQHFQDPSWQALAYYYAEKFDVATALFRQIDSPAGRFNVANALAQGQHYVLALKAYQVVLQETPSHAAARKNHAMIEQIVDDINRMSASQQAEPGAASKELGDAPQRGDGAEQADISNGETPQLTAEQLLADEQIHEMWMRQVQADPRRFLSAKFQFQYHRQKATKSEVSKP